jgi:hypothetical protein
VPRLVDFVAHTQEFYSWPYLYCSLTFFVAIKIEKAAGEQVDYNSMKVKQLKTILGMQFFS